MCGGDEDRMRTEKASCSKKKSNEAWRTCAGMQSRCSQNVLAFTWHSFHPALAPSSSSHQHIPSFSLSITTFLTFQHEEKSNTREMHSGRRAPMLGIRLSIYPNALCSRDNAENLGTFDGQEWLWKDIHALHHFLQLHCQRHTQTWCHK